MANEKEIEKEVTAEISVDNGETVLPAPPSVPSPTPLTGTDALTAKLEAARKSAQKELFKGKKQVMANRLRRELTDDPKKRMRLAQNALVSAALAGFSANDGEGEWEQDMIKVLDAGKSAALRAVNATPTSDLGEAFDASPVEEEGE